MQKDYQIGSLIMQSQKELAAKHFVIRGKIGLIRKSDGKELATYDVVFPIYLTGFRHLASEKFNTKVAFSLISVNLSELSNLSVYEVNRIASNVNRLSLRVNACLSENAFKKLLSIKQFTLHQGDPMRERPNTGRVVTALRHPKINKDNTLYIYTIKGRGKWGISYTGITLKKENRMLIVK